MSDLIDAKDFGDMSLMGVVLDANVLFPASLRDTLLRSAGADLYRLYLSDEILEETRRNLVLKKKMSEDQSQQLSAAIYKSFPEAFVTGYDNLIPAMTNEEKDRHVLATAVRAGAQIIVTKNLKDFPLTNLSLFNIAAQSPDDFLVDLYYLDSDRIARVLTQQVNDLHKPDKTLPEVLETLAQHAPTFVSFAKCLFNLNPHF